MPKQFSEDPASSCAFTYSDGRHCRMLRFTNTSKYCIHHARKLRHLEDTAFDLLKPIRGSFVSATALTRSLTLLFADVAEGRIQAKDAVAMACVANTLLKTIPLSKQEFQHVYKDEYYSQLVCESFVDLPPYIPEGEEHDNDQTDDARDENADRVNQLAQAKSDAR